MQIKLKVFWSPKDGQWVAVCRYTGAATPIRDYGESWREAADAVLDELESETDLTPGLDGVIGDDGV